MAVPAGAPPILPKTQVSSVDNGDGTKTVTWSDGTTSIHPTAAKVTADTLSAPVTGAKPPTAGNQVSTAVAPPFAPWGYLPNGQIAPPPGNSTGGRPGQVDPQGGQSAPGGTYTPDGVYHPPGATTGSGSGGVAAPPAQTPAEKAQADAKERAHQLELQLGQEAANFVPTAAPNISGAPNTTATLFTPGGPAPVSGFNPDQAGQVTFAPAQGYTAQGYQAAQGTAAQFTGQERASAQGYSAAQAGFAPTVSAGTATAGHVDAPIIGAPGSIVAPVINQPDAIHAGTVTAQQIGPVSISNPADIHASNIDRIQMDSTDANQSRSQFEDALAKIKLAAEGATPSAAEALLQKGIDQNVGSAYGLAASLAGRNAGQALNVGAMTAQKAIAGSSADMAALRAQEQATARGQYAQFAASLNANDIQKGGLQLASDTTVATANASNLLEAAKSNQTAKVQTSIANLNAMVDVLKANQASALQAGMSNQAADLQAKIENLHATISVATSNAANSLTTQINNIQNQIEVAKANQATQLAAGQTNASLQTQTSIANMQAQLQAAMSNQAMISNTNIQNAKFVNDASQFTAQAMNNLSQFNASQTNAIGQFNTAETNTTRRANTLATNTASQFTAGANNAANQFNTGETNTTNRAQDTERGVTNRFNTGQSNAAGQAFTDATNLSNNNFSQQTATAGNANADRQAGVDKANADRQQATQQFNADKNLQQQMINDAKQKGYTDQQIQLILAQAGLDETTLQGALDRAEKEKAAKDAALGAIGGGLMSVFSSRHLKTNIKDGNSYSREFLNALESRVWDYKDPAAHGTGTRLGPMVEDIERSMAGRSIIVDMPGAGNRGIDAIKAVGPILSGLGDLNQRLKALEEKKKRK